MIFGSMARYLGKVIFLLPLLLSLLMTQTVMAASFDAFGETFVREKGKPKNEERTFNVANPQYRYTLKVWNGGLPNSGHNKISSATIKINGVEIVSPNEFNQQVDFIEKQITLTESEVNLAVVQLRSKPNGALHINIVGESTPPTIVTTPVNKVEVNASYLYDVDADDPDSGDLLSYTLKNAPEKMSIDASTGKIIWTPTNTEVGNHDVTVRVTDLAGLFDEQTYVLTVIKKNEAPKITTQVPNTSLKTGDTFAYDVDAIDADGDKILFRLEAAPSGMSIDANTGKIVWTPANDQVGNHTVTVVAEDELGQSDRQILSLTVELLQTNQAPSITSTAPTTATEGTAYNYAVNAQDPDVGDTLGYALTDKPSTMIINPNTGLIEWTPTNTEVGNHNIIVRVTDLAGLFDEQTYVLTVIKKNEAPKITTQAPNTPLKTGDTFTYDVDATDADGDTIHFRLEASPSGMSIDTNTGKIVWIPANDQVGNHTVTVVAEDELGQSDRQTFSLTVELLQTNQAPSITSTAPTTATEGIPYNYAVNAQDPDAGDTLSYALTEKPSTMIIDPNTGLIEWTPTNNEVGNVTVTIKVTDQDGLSATQTFTMTVSAEVISPQVTIKAEPSSISVGQSSTITVTATDNVGVVSLVLTIDGNPLALDANNKAVFTANTVGSYNALVTATDAAGNTATESTIIEVVTAGISAPNVVGQQEADAKNVIEQADLVVGNITRVQNATIAVGEVISQNPAGGDSVATGTAIDLVISNGDTSPVLSAEIITPTSGTSLSSPLDVIGTVIPLGSGANLKWRVELNRINDGTPQIIAQGTGAVSQSSIAVVDPTLLTNDSYNLTLIAEEDGANASQTVAVDIIGNLKLGNFRLEFRDLSIPVAGIPITISRVYDTLDLSQGDFGAGWRLGFPGDIRENIAADKAFTTATRIFVTKPDGQRVGFTFAPRRVGLISFTYEPDFQPDAGVYDTLSVETRQLLKSGGQFFDFDIAYNPEQYFLTTKEGIKYTIVQDEGLKQVVDRNGNTLDITPDGITSSTGVKVEFVRDANGRIQKIIEPDSDTTDNIPPPELEYQYDGNGNLTAFFDQLDNKTTYSYDEPRFPNYLTEIEDSLGRNVLRSVYDNSGRLVATCDANGNLTTLEGCVKLELADGDVQNVYDARGFKTIYVYDARGNVLQKNDPLSGVTKYVYDDLNNPDKETSVTDANGNTTRFEYDVRGNLLVQTDALGNTTTYTFDPNNKPTSITERLGIKRTATYDGFGNITNINDGLGNNVLFGFNSFGLVTSTTDPVGSVTIFDYTKGCCGRPGTVTNSDGSQRQISYDSKGNVLTQTDETGAIVQFEYDALDRVVKRTDAALGETINKYNGLDLVQTTDALGNITRYEYDVFGQLTKEIDSEGGQTIRSYDENRNLISVTDSIGNKTQFAYDANDKLVLKIDPLGNREQFVYDDVGNLVEHINRNSKRRTFSYNVLNQMIAENWLASDNSVIRVITFEYDAEGKELLVGDADGVISRTYDDRENVIQVEYSGGVLANPITLSYEYDKTNRQTAVRDNNGVEVLTEYDSRSAYSTRIWQGSIIDPVRVNYSRNERGDIVQIERFGDALGNLLVSKSNFDNIDPRGLVGSMTHADINANSLEGTDYTYSYDNKGRLITSQHHNNQSIYKYDNVDQLLSVNNTLLPNEIYSYDLNGNRTSSHVHGNNYVTAANNQLVEDGDFQYQYDAEGNLVSKREIVSGKLTTFEWDHRNRLVKALTSTGDVAQFVYDAEDRRIGRIVNGVRTTTIYDGSNAWSDLDSSGSLAVQYLFEPQIDKNLARWKSGEGTVWYLTDKLGTVRDLQDSAGNLVAHIDYDSYGNVLFDSEPTVSDRYRYTGREYDPVLGMYYYRARYYNPSTGRFVSEDPLGFDAGDSNLYRYVLNSPSNSVDPKGESLIPYILRVAKVYSVFETVQEIDCDYTSNPIGCQIDLLPADPFGFGANRVFKKLAQRFHEIGLELERAVQ